MNTHRDIPEQHFPSTHWSSVMAAGETETDQGREALDRLLRRYQPALKAYLIEKFRCRPAQADDLFQSFALEIVIRKELVARARPMPGHLFRSFLLCALHNFTTSEYRREQAQKRRPAGGFSSVEELLEMDLGPEEKPSSAAFDLAWARSVIAEAVRQMGADCAARGCAEVWAVFEHRLLRPILEGIEPVAYEELVGRLGLLSSAHAQNLLYRGKQMFARCLRSIVAEYAADESDGETELCELQAILAETGG